MRHSCVLQLLVGTVIVAALCGCGNDHLTVGRDSGDMSESRNSRLIVGECLVTFYDDFGNEYFSRQKHRIQPLKQAIEITANEPQGLFRWQVSHGSYQFSSPGEDAVQSPVSVINANILRTLLISFTVSDDYYGADLGNEGGKVKMEGRWYETVTFVPDGASDTRVTLFKNADENTIDVVYVEDTKTHEIVIGRLYNFELIEAAKRRVPTKIDVLQAKSLNAEPERTMKVHYNALGDL